MNIPEPEPRVEFSFQLTEKDIAGMYNEVSARRRRRYLPAGVVVAFAGMAGIIAQPERSGVATTVMAAGALLIYLGTFATGAFQRAAVRRFRLTPSALVKTRYEVFDDHLAVTSELGHSEIRWPGFLTRKEMTGYLVPDSPPGLVGHYPSRVSVPQSGSASSRFG